MSKSISSTKMPKIAVIGGGIFGGLISAELASQGFSVSLYERNEELMLGASLNNQNRLHLGYHYPRDDNTALQCIKGFQRFREAFPNCISTNFSNHYYISSRDTKVSMSDYKRFCLRVGLPFTQVSKDFDIDVRNVDGGISTEEVVYDSRLLSLEVQKLLYSRDVEIFCNHNISTVNKLINKKFLLEANNIEVGIFDHVINCTYANYNKFNKGLNKNCRTLQYEYTLVPIIRWIDRPVGITVMDGSFMTVLPFGLSENFLLYHVEHTVIKTEFSEQLNEEWLKPETSPASSINKQHHFEKMLEACIEFVPGLESAELVGFLEGPRVVFAGKDSTDERPSIIDKIDEDGFYSIFSGKIDHSIWVADQVSDSIIKHQMNQDNCISSTKDGMSL